MPAKATRRRPEGRGQPVFVVLLALMSVSAVSADDNITDVVGSDADTGDALEEVSADEGDVLMQDGHWKLTLVLHADLFKP